MIKTFKTKNEKFSFVLNEGSNYYNVFLGSSIKIGIYYYHSTEFMFQDIPCSLYVEDMQQLLIAVSILKP